MLGNRFLLHVMLHSLGYQSTESKMFLIFYLEANAQVCMRTAQTCCPQQVEESIDVAAFENIRELMPVFSRYLNESDANFFSHYG